MVNFKKADFEKMSFRVDKIDNSTNIFKTFPVLKVYPEFRIKLKGVSFWKVIKYMGIMYQLNSPFLTIDNFTKRKIEAAVFSDFGRNDENEFSEPYLNILHGKNSDFNLMVIRFCRIQKSTVFSRLIVFEQALYADLEILKNIDSDDDMKQSDKKTLRENIQNLSSDIDSLIQQLLFEDENKYLISEIFEEIELEQLALKPEDIATKLRMGENPVNVYPYGRDYKIPRIRYASVVIK